MKRTNKRLIIFLIPILMAWFGVEYFYRNVPNNYTVKNTNINKQSNEIEVLLFGTSHCFYGLNPKYFSENTFNLSNISQTIYFDKLLFDKYIDRLPKLKKVVFCIEYTNLSQRDNIDEDAFRKYYYENYMNLEVPIVSDFDPKKYSLAFTRSLEQSIKLINKYYQKGSIVDCDNKVWGNDYLKKDRIAPESVAKERAKNHEDGLLDFALNKSRINQMIAECKKRNIQVLIVSMPQTNAYNEYLNQKKLNLIFETCRGFELENKNTVRYLNLFKDKRFVNDDFYDADHLNNVGAIKCSKIVNEFLTLN